MIVEQPRPKYQYRLKSFKKYSMGSPGNTLKLYDHSAVLWGKYMYLWGGDNNKLTKVAIKKESNFHKVQLDNFTWETVQGSAVVPAHVHSHCCQMVGHEMFIFGGSDESYKSNNHMWGYNFIAKVFKKHNGLYPPSPRQSASIVRLNEYLVLYGGVNLEAKEIYNQFYLYEIKTGVWSLLAPNKQIPIRTFQKMVAIGKRIYLFGGNDESGVSSLNDFYRISIIDKKQCDVQKIETEVTPPPRMSHGMSSFVHKYIIIIGGQKELRKKPELLNDAWIYDCETNEWNEIDTQGRFESKSHFSVIQYKEQLVIFGGMKENGVDDSLIVFGIEHTSQAEQREKVEREIMQQEPVLVSDYIPVERPNLEFIFKAASMIKFPFAAFGLLIDNCINSHSNFINISVIDRVPSSSYFNNRVPYDREKDTSSLRGLDNVERFIYIEDDGRTWNNEEFPQIIFNSQVNDDLLMDVFDKKTKAMVIKDNLKKEFGINLKFGCFRLGKAFLYISGYENYLRVALMTGKQSTTDFGTYYYCEDLKNRRFLTQNGPEIKRTIENLCKGILRARILDELTATNQLYIFDLQSFYTIRGTFYELNPYNNDYIYNCLHEVEFLDKINFPILQCPDVSLKSYLSLLYLKNDTKITLQTNKKAKDEVLNQLFIDKIDKQKERGFVREIDYANLYPELAECKIVELYYDETMDERCDSFHAGILIYHKNRLICRYKYDLGRMFQLKFYPRRYRKGKTNVLQFFGYIQLPDEMSINIFKTGVTNQILLEGFNSNIQLIIKDMKRRIVSKSKPETIPNYLQIHDKVQGQQPQNEKLEVQQQQYSSDELLEIPGDYGSSDLDDEQEDQEGTPINQINRLMDVQEEKPKQKDGPK